MTTVWSYVAKGLDSQPPVERPLPVAPVTLAVSAVASIRPTTDGLAATAPPVSAPDPAASTLPGVSLSCAQELAQASAVSAHAKQEVARLFQDVRLGQAIELSEVATVVEQISASVLRHPMALISLTRLRMADEYTYIHSVLVCALMTAVARQMELPAAQVQLAGQAGLLHDVGKMRMPLEVLNKPGGGIRRDAAAP